MDLNYAGNITVADAWDLLSSDTDSVLVDVRTEQEWNEVGIPDLSSVKKDVVKLPLLTAPNFELNASFTSELSKLLPEKGKKVLFMCKAGGRSAQAAEIATQMGYSEAYNIEGGFSDAWLPAELPWRQN